MAIRYGVRSNGSLNVLLKNCLSNNSASMLVIILKTKQVWARFSPSKVNTSSSTKCFIVSSVFDYQKFKTICDFCYSTK